MSDYDYLAQFYTPQRSGYSNELYNTILGFGLNPRHHVLDVACGAGTASRPLIENGFRVTGVDDSAAMLALARERLPAGNWVDGRAEALPLAAGSVDAAICAQAFHRLDAVRAFGEIVRTVKPRGVVAIWWKSLATDDPVKVLRDAVTREFGIAPMGEGLIGGFKSFYASALTDATLRVVPWRATVTLEEFMAAERSRLRPYYALSKRAPDYFSRLEQRLRERFGEGKILLALSLLQFLYLARTPQ